MGHYLWYRKNIVELVDPGNLYTCFSQDMFLQYIYCTRGEQ